MDWIWKRRKSSHFISDCNEIIFKYVSVLAQKLLSNTKKDYSN